MALLKHLGASLTRQVVQMSRLSPSLSPSAASAYRCLGTLATRLLLTSVPRTGSNQLLSFSLGPQYGPAVLGQCEHPACIQPSAGMKTKSALKRRCKDCFFVRRRGRLFVFCKTNPRHKQRQG